MVRFTREHVYHVSVTTEVGDQTSDRSAYTDRSFRERLADLPPSAKLVAKVLEHESPMTQAELAEETLLPTRTVRYALERLERVDLVTSKPSLRDARKRVYELT